MFRSNKPDKRASVDINIFHQGHAHVDARLLAKTASSLGVKLTRYYMSALPVRKLTEFDILREKASARASKRYERVLIDILGQKAVKTIEGVLCSVISRRFQLFFLDLRGTSKDQASRALESFLADAKTEEAWI